ncbi:DUF916 and DUF3324 domain-containing protein [Enterococcus plantarum]|nr:DUF916 and DUF3324 domain-containing protein [Enterococcus plantarum]
MAFSVETIQPKNQVDLSKTYFDLKGSPDSEQLLEVKLHNSTKQEVVVDSQIAPATTNLNGVVEYSPREQKLDPTLKYDLSKLLTYADEKQKDGIVLPKESETILKLKLKYPKDAFDGSIAGGITFKEKKKNIEDDKEAKGLSIQNDYAFVVAVVLHGSENEITSKLEMPSVAAGQVNARNVINATLQNPQPKYLSQLKVDAKVTRLDKKEVLYQVTKDQMQMAPNSNFDFPVSLEGNPLAPGKYTLTLRADSFEDTWTFSKNFVVTSKQAKELNEKDVTINKNWTWLYISVGVFLLLAFLIIAVYLYRRNKKKEQVKRKKRLKEQMKRSKKRKSSANKKKKVRQYEDQK